MPPDRVWVLHLFVLNRIYNFALICRKQGIVWKVREQGRLRNHLFKENIFFKKSSFPSTQNWIKYPPSPQEKKTGSSYLEFELWRVKVYRKDPKGNKVTSCKAGRSSYDNIDVLSYRESTNIGTWRSCVQKLVRVRAHVTTEHLLFPCEFSFDMFVCSSSCL